MQSLTGITKPKYLYHISSLVVEEASNRENEQKTQLLKVPNRRPEQSGGF